MNMLPELDTFKLADAHKPPIGFRVVVSGGEERLRNSLEARDPQAKLELTSLLLRDHLTWKRAPSPFVSLWKSWPRAVRWAESCARRGARDVHIMAVWIDDQVVYDAHKAAKMLPFPRNKPSSFYKDEVVILGLGGKDDYSILAGFYWVTERWWRMVTFVPNKRTSSTFLPIGPLSFEASSVDDEIERRQATAWEEGAFVALRDEIYSRTGLYDNEKAKLLAQILCKRPSCPGGVLSTSSEMAFIEFVAELAEPI